MAEPFETFTSKVIPLPAENVDTDQIVPARYLKVTDKEGLADALFRDWRFEEDGSLRQPRFILDQPEMAGRRILLAGGLEYRDENTTDLSGAYVFPATGQVLSTSEQPEGGRRVSAAYTELSLPLHFSRERTRMPGSTCRWQRATRTTATSVRRTITRWR